MESRGDKFAPRTSERAGESVEEEEHSRTDLRAARELLEASKAQLDATLSEIRATRSFLKEKAEALSRQNTDLGNVIVSLDLGIIHVDRQMRIVRFTRRATDVFELSESEIGRPLPEIRHNLKDITLREELENALDSPHTIDRIIETTAGHAYLMRLCPYRTEDTISGAVLTFLDISEQKRSEDELVQSRDRLRVALEASQLGVWELNLDTRELQTSDQHKARLGLPRKVPLTIDKVLNHIHPDDQKDVQYVLKEGLKDPENHHITFRILAPDTSMRWFECHCRVVSENDFAGRRMVGTSRDVTKREEIEQLLAHTSLELERRIVERTKEGEALNKSLRDEIEERILAEQDLQRARDRFEKVFRLNPFGAFIATLDEGILLETNESFSRLTGYTEAAVLHRPLHDLDLIQPPSRCQELLATLQQEGGAWGVELKLTTPDGTERDVLLFAKPLVSGNEKHILAMFYDVTEQRELERRLQHLSEREQQRIGRDLHDTLGQQLVGITYLARKLLRELKQHAEPLVPQVEQLLRECDQTVEFTRSFARMLAPLPMEENNLSEALHLLCVNTERMFNVPCRLNIQVDRPVTEKTAATQLYRIAQEAHINAAKHADADEIWLHFSSDDEQIILQVEDNGIGISEHELTSREGMGIRTMQYRARMIGAQLTIESPPEGGTRVTCVLRHNREPNARK